jgi:predicted ribonuclease toxin of YeeF-YezG toxin-antitoxin module
MIVAFGSLMVGSNVFTEQPVYAQNMTVNMTDLAGNMSQIYDSGSGSGSISKKNSGRISSKDQLQMITENSVVIYRCRR